MVSLEIVAVSGFSDQRSAISYSATRTLLEVLKAFGHATRTAYRSRYGNG
ncbi:hypothetical protein [Moorena producens]